MFVNFYLYFTTIKNFAGAVTAPLKLKHTTSGISRRTVFTSSTSSSVKGPPNFSLPKSIRVGCSSSI